MIVARWGGGDRRWSQPSSTEKLTRAEAGSYEVRNDQGDGVTGKRMWSSISWMTLLRESLAVLAAILVAFGLDAWWGARVEREAAMDALRTVRAEVQRNRVELARVLQVNEGVVSAVMKMAETDQEQFATMDPQTLLEYDASTFEAIQAETAAVGAFLSLGHLAALRSQALMEAVSGIPQAWEEVEEEGDISTHLWIEAATQMVHALGAEGMISLMAGDDPAALRRSFAAFRAAKAYTDASFTAALFTRIYIGELSTLDTQLAELLQLIDEELPS